MTITETLAENVTAGMRRQYNKGTATVVAVVRESPRSQWMRVTYRSDSAITKPDGGVRHNIFTMRAKRGSYLPIVDDAPVHVHCREAGVDRNIVCVEG